MLLKKWIVYSHVLITTFVLANEGPNDQSELCKLRMDIADLKYKEADLRQTVDRMAQSIKLLEYEIHQLRVMHASVLSEKEKAHKLEMRLPPLRPDHENITQIAPKREHYRPMEKPDRYKTQLCQNFFSNGKCNSTEDCPFAHCAEEMRAKPLRLIPTKTMFIS